MSGQEKTVTMEIEGDNYSLTIVEEGGKVFARGDFPGYGEFQVPDFGGGEARAIREARSRLMVLRREAKEQQVDSEV